METTTIQIRKSIKSRLEHYKLSGNESYNEVIERLLEDVTRINDKTRQELKKARAEIAAGKFKDHEQLGRELGF